MGRRLAGDWKTLLLGGADQLDLAAAADMDDVKRQIVEMTEAETDGNHKLLGVNGDRAK